MRLLITAFEPFNNDNINPSLEVLKEIGDYDKLILPVSYMKAKIQLLNKINDLKPDIILSLGYAASRTNISIESSAYNETKARIPDNDGLLLSGGKVVESGEEELKTIININDIIETTKEYNTYISDDPGRFICNEVYYLALKEMNGKALFIHLPNMKYMIDNLPCVLKIIEFIKERYESKFI